MKRVGIVGAKTIKPAYKLEQFIFKLKNSFSGELTIVSGGNKDGVERIVKNTSLKFGINYVEFTPLYAFHNGFSITKETDHGKPRNITFDIDRYTKLSRYCDEVFVIDDLNFPDPALKGLKKNVKCKCINLI